MTARRFAADVTALVIVRLISMAAGLAVSVLAARLMGPVALGVAGAVQTLGLAAAVVANGGLNIATIYQLGARPTERASVIATLRPFAVVAVLAAAVAGLTAAAAAQGGLGFQGRASLVVLAGVLAAGVVSYEYWSSVLLGLGHGRAYTTSELVRALATLVATALVLLALWRDEAGYLAGAGVAYFGAAMYAQRVARGLLPQRAERYDRGLLWTSVGMGLRGQVGNVLQFLNLRLDLLLVPALLGAGPAGVYLVAVRVSEVVAQAASAGGSLLFPRVAATAGDASATTLTELTARRSLLLVLMTGILIATAAEPLLSVFGRPFVEGATAVRVLLLAMLPLTLTRVLAGDLKGRGRAGAVSIAMGAALVLTVALDLWLIPMIGITGAALASLIAYSASSVGLGALFIRVAPSSAWRLLPRWSDATGIAGWLWRRL